MSVSIPDFWKLLIESQLLTREQCQHLASQFGSSQGATDDGQALAKWLIAQNIISRYQAAVLLAGRAGPFCYGDYKIYERIEQGRLAGWFRAVHIATNHPTLLKFLAGEAAQNAAWWPHIVAAVGVTAHPNLARFYEAVDLGAYKFLVAEDLRGQTLAERLQAGGSLPADEACRVTRLIAVGLAHLHQAGRPHGDPRPANFWLETTGHVKVLLEPDALPAAPNLAQSNSNGEMLARAEYFAPEFLQSGKAPDQLTDIYALGCSLYELIAAQPPFPGGTLSEKMQRHSTEAIQPLENVGAPQAVGQAVAYMMAKNPSVRYQQAAVVAEQLGQFVGAAQANSQPASPPATLAAYQAALQQKQAATAAPAAPAAKAPTAQPATAVPAVKSAAKPPAPAVSPAAKPNAGKAAQAASVAAARRARQKARQKNNLIMFGSAIGIAAVLLIVGVFVLANMGGNTPDPSLENEVAQVDPKQNVQQVTDDGDSATAPETEVGEDVPNADGAGGGSTVEDDGETLWASPTDGPPIELKYVPSGARVLMIVRPADMLSQSHGAQVLKALGPGFADSRERFESACGFPLDQIEQLTLACYPNAGQFPKICTVVRLASPATPDAMLSKWGDPPEIADLPSTYGRPEAAYYIPSDAAEKTFVMGPLDPELRDLVEGKPQFLQRELGRLLRGSDEQRHVTLLFARDFFYSGSGKQLFAGSRSKALDALEWFFGDGLKAGMVGLQFGEPFYFELRAQNDVTVDARTLADGLRERIDAIPESIESHLYKLNPPQYWKPMVLNFKPMIRELHAYTRTGVDQDQPMVNSVLPGVAAHNLAFGGEMLLALSPGGVVAAAPTTTKAVPQNISQVLASKITLSFPELDLNLAMQEAQDTVQSEFTSLPFQFKIKILGGDLEDGGITRNQKVLDFNLQDATVSGVLTAMVRKANPVPNVQDPSEPDQKLIWVVGPDPEQADDEIVLITTRKAAGQKEYTLPEVFRPR